MNPRITVVTPSIPPRAEQLQRALRSVALQTLPAAAVSIAVDLDREGAAVTRQRALDAVRTPWLAFLDDDDELMPHHLETLWRHAEEAGADYVFSWFKVVVGGRVLEHDPVFPPTHFTAPWDRANPRQTTITVLVRTDLAKEAGFVRPNDGATVDGLPWGEDWTFTLRCNELGTISHVVQHTWLWHHGGNTSGRPVW